MKRAMCFIAVGVIVLMGSGVASAGVGGTDHDFSGSGWSRGEICLPCHTPHNTLEAEYLWNHAMPASSDFTKREGSVLGVYSLMCLGCHDGQTAIDSVGGQTGSTVITGDSNIGRDLTDDHPVGIVYDDGHGRRAPIGTVWGGSKAGIANALPLFESDNRLECVTCHTPHDDTNDGFLRISNVGSGLCITCHLSQGT